MTTASDAIMIEPAGDRERCWPHVTALLDAGGNVTLGRVKPIDDVAVAANDRRVLATLKRRKGERAADLMQRLDDALNHAAHGGAPINEINGGHFAMSRPRAGKRR